VNHFQVLCVGHQPIILFYAKDVSWNSETLISISFLSHVEYFYYCVCAYVDQISRVATNSNSSKYLTVEGVTHGLCNFLEAWSYVTTSCVLSYLNLI
jgi:hypothetical protein